jgi:hypothetical protein
MALGLADLAAAAVQALEGLETLATASTRGSGDHVVLGRYGQAADYVQEAVDSGGVFILGGGLLGYAAFKAIESSKCLGSVRPKE